MSRELTRRILWADDEIDLLKPHIKFLEQKGYLVTPVSSGTDALSALERERYDVLLIDEKLCVGCDNWAKSTSRCSTR